MRFKALAKCFIAGRLMEAGEEADLPDSTPDTEGVLVALDRPRPEPEILPPVINEEEDEGGEDEAEGGELAGDAESPPRALTRGEKAAATRAANRARAQQTTTE